MSSQSAYFYILPFSFICNMVKEFESLVTDIQLNLRAVFLKKADRNPERRAMTEATKIPWYLYNERILNRNTAHSTLNNSHLKYRSWVAVSVAKVLSEYPTGLTHSVLLSILELEVTRTRYLSLNRKINAILQVGEIVSKEIQRI